MRRVTPIQDLRMGIFCVTKVRQTSITEEESPSEPEYVEEAISESQKLTLLLILFAAYHDENSVNKQKSLHSPCVIR